MKLLTFNLLFIVLLQLLLSCGVENKADNTPSSAGCETLADNSKAIYTTKNNKIQFLLITNFEPTDFIKTSFGSNSMDTFQGYWQKSNNKMYLEIEGKEKPNLIQVKINGQNFNLTPGQIVFFDSNREIHLLPFVFIGTLSELKVNNNLNHLIQNIH